MRRFQTARRSRKRARRSSAPWPTSTPNSRAAASRSRTSRGVMRAGPWASRWGRGYECDPQDSRPSPAVERRAGGGRNDEEYPCGISRSSAPRLRRQSAAGRRKRISGHAPSVPNEARHQIRGRLDDAGCVAPPRNSANYSSSSRASAADPPPTSATDFGSGTLALGWLRARRPPHAIGGQDDHLPIVALALAPRRNGGIALQGQVDHAPVPGAHGVQRDGPPGLLGLLSEPPRQLSQMFEPPLPITFDFNHHPPRNRVLSADDPIHDVLEGIESLAPPADEEAAAVGAHREENAPRVRSGPHLDSARHAKAREDGLERVLAPELERRRRRRRVRCCLWRRLGARVLNLSMRRFVVLHRQQGFPGIHVGRFVLQTTEPAEQGRAHRCPDASLLPPEPE